MTKSLVIDAHVDTLLKKYFSVITRLLSTDSLEYHVTPEFLKTAGIDVQVFAMFTPPKLEKIALEVTLEMISIAKDMAKNEDLLLIQSLNDLNSISDDSMKRIGMVLSVEGAEAFERNLKVLPRQLEV